MDNKLNSKKGFALLMAIMIGSLFLAIGATIYRIALVEIILSSTGRDSQFAFYSADSGLECALFWNYHYIPSGHDNSGSAFSVYNEASGDENGSNRNLIIAGSIDMIDCGGGDVQDFRLGDIQFGGANQTYFKIDVPGSGLCAEVVVGKWFDSDLSNPNNSLAPAIGTLPNVTTITSHGYNTCADSERKVERAIKATLQ